MSSWRVRDVISQKHAVSQPLLREHSSVSQNLTQTALLILLFSIQVLINSFHLFHFLNLASCLLLLCPTYSARLSVAFLYPFFLPYQLNPLCWVPGSVTLVFVSPPPTLFGVLFWSPVPGCSSLMSFVSLCLLLLYFLGMKEEAESPHRWFFNLMFDSLYV